MRTSTGPGNRSSSAEVDTGTSTVQSVDRALSILSLLAQAGELGVTQIASSLGVHKSTAFRLVATLEHHDLVTQTAERGKFRLGMGLISLAAATSASLDLVQLSRPVTERLATELGETVNVTILAEGHALYLDQVTSNSALQPHSWVGQRIALHASSNGKVLLAFLAEAAAALLLEGPLDRLTENTVTDAGRLRAELDQVRRIGFAVAVDELEIGLTAVAAPVRSAQGTVVASLSASGPSARITAEVVPVMAAKVVDAAGRISRRLGWFPRPMA